MNRKQRNLPRWDGMLGFSLLVILLNALVCVEPAAAQCGPGGPDGSNTQCGTGALANNTIGTYDSAFGFDALFSNTGGGANTASGYHALYSNTSGGANTASGYHALYSNTSGYSNTASGLAALYYNTFGYANTASGWAALFYNTIGFYNTASGVDTLFRNTTGSDNTANGDFALFSNTTGNSNTTSGYHALASNTTGSGNIGLGFNAGNNIMAGSNNIEIGGSGSSDESNTIRIGTQGAQTATFVAGIFGRMVNSSSVPVFVDNTGKLGVTVSSARYKRDIRDMGAASSGLMKLRPVVFRYRNDPNGQQQYGLIAEEVARVYPELVDYDNDGKPLMVRYLELNAMLLNEVQKQANQLQTQANQLQTETNQLQAQTRQLRMQDNQLQTQAHETQELAQRLETKDRQLAAQQHEIDALKQQNASINTLSQRLAALEQQVSTATPQRLRSLASK
jgi:Chaperone of endosialidase